MSELPPTDRDQRLERVLADFLHAAGAGPEPDRAELLRRFPDLADDLASFFRNRDALQQLAEPLLRDAARSGATQGFEGDGSFVAGDRVAYFGDYELLQEIARGGMGVVFRARQVSLNRVVALKMILTGQLASEADVARFRAEAAAAANLDHPNIVPVYEVGEHLGQHYFSMKFIEGGTLADRLGTLRDDPRTGAQLVAVVARAVHYAHQRGILHRDLKPANILLEADGTPQVVDFGLARRVGGPSATRSGAVVGTPSYMAPEQARAEKQVSTAADVYALGAILYECLTGVPPFRADNVVDTLLQVATQEPRHPQALWPRANADLCVVALKCLSKEPARRYESAAALADELDRWLRNEPILARPTGLLGRLLLWTRRRPTQAALVAVSLVSAVTLGVVLAISGARIVQKETALKQEKGKVDERERQVTELEQQVRQQVDRAERHLGELYASRGALYDEQDDWSAGLLCYALAVQADGNDPERVAAHRLRYRSHLPRDVRLKEVLDLSRPREGEAWTSPLPGSGWSGGPMFWLGGEVVARSADGRIRARAYDRSDGPWPKFVVVVEDTVSGKEIFRYDLDLSDPLHLSLSGDGRWLVVWWEENGVTDRDTGAALFDLRTGRPFAPLAGVVVRQAWISPDGSRLLAVEVPKEGTPAAHLWDLAAGKRLKADIPLPDASEASATGFGPGGVLLVRHADHLSILDAATGANRAGSPLRIYGPIRDVAISPDGRRAATLLSTYLRVWDLNSGRAVGPQLPQLIHRGGTMHGHVAFSPDGRRLLVVEPSNKTSYLWQLDPPEREPRDGAETLAVDEAGRLLAVRNGQQAVVRDGLTGRALARFPLAEAAPTEFLIYNMTFDPTGKALALWGKLLVAGKKRGESSPVSRTVEVRNVTGAVVVPALIHELPVRRVALGVGGRVVATFCQQPRADHEMSFVGGLAPMPWQIRVWDVPAGRSRTIAVATTTNSSGTGALVFRSDESQLLGSTPDGWFVWDVVSGKEVARLPATTRDALFGPSGRVLVLTADKEGRLAVTDAEGHQPIALDVTVQERAPAFFSPDGAHVLAATPQHEAVLCQASDGRCLFRGPALHSVDGLALSPDGRRLLTVNSHSALLWDVASGRAVDDLIRPGDEGLQPFALGEGGRARVLSAAWETAPEERPVEDLMREAELLSGRRWQDDRLEELTPDELRERLRRRNRSE